MRKRQFALFNPAAVRGAYDRIVLGHPRIVLLLLLLVLSILGYHAGNFRLDASADTLVLEHDEDLRYLYELNEHYGIAEFLLIAYTPDSGDLFSDTTRQDLARLRDELRKLPRVASVMTILDVPLLRNPPVPLKELSSNIKTLETDGVDLALAADEIRGSPLYRGLLVSPSMRSTALLVNLEGDDAYSELLSRRSKLRDAERDEELGPGEMAELAGVEDRYAAQQDAIKEQRHADIASVRAIMSRNAGRATLFLGGVPMIADDMITFIRKDLKVFGLGMMVFLVLTLYAFFRRVRWVVLAMACCFCSVLAMIGLLGMFGWQVTVISSNFISLQLVVTMALTIHLIERFTELQAELPEADNHTLARETVRTIFIPCFYTSTTTIAGFASLMVCDILPVVTFGWMMAMGLVVSFVTTFLLFPTWVVLLPRPISPHAHRSNFTVTGMFARFTERHAPIILTASAALVIATVIGILDLKVENSFIDYFKESTEIYQGMRYIDRELGGTTPLEVVLRFDEEDKETAVPEEATETESDGGDLFDEFEEFEEAESDEKYWFTPEKIAKLAKAHDYLEGLAASGKVLSLNTLVKVVAPILGNEELNTFDMALLLSQIPDEFKGILVDPYVSAERNELRLNMRIKDSLEGLKRKELLEMIETDLESRLGMSPEQVRLGGVMVLYNNMLQSLFRSQIQTIGLTVVALLLMFVVLFRSVKLALIAIFPNLAASLTVLGVMGLLGIPLDMMTITIVAISIGIAVDNTIHYIHRFKHEFPRDRRYLPTMHRCHGSIGNAMYYTSVTVIVGFSILVLSNFIPSVLFGVLTGLAMTVALLAALTLLPRLILLFKPFGSEG
jgi:predicted RND superfamily exporter protein